MTNEKMSNLIEARFISARATLCNKAKEYASEDSRFYNFYTAGDLLGVDPKIALMGMAIKHFVSCLDLAKGKLANTEQYTDEKIGDMINYLLLLEAMLHEERT